MWDVRVEIDTKLEIAAAATRVTAVNCYCCYRCHLNTLPQAGPKAQDRPH